MALSDQDWRLAEALAIHRRHGRGAALHVAERLGELPLAGDRAGVERWQRIATALDQYMRAPRQ